MFTLNYLFPPSFHISFFGGEGWLFFFSFQYLTSCRKKNLVFGRRGRGTNWALGKYRVFLKLKYALNLKKEKKIKQEIFFSYECWSNLLRYEFNRVIRTLVSTSTYFSPLLRHVVIDCIFYETEWCISYFSTINIDL